MIGFKTYAIVILFFHINLQTSFSQVNNKPINYRFETKEKGLIDLIQNNVRYPSSSINDKTVGISISSITITPNGDIEKIAIINSVDKAIDKEVIRLLKMTKTNWTKCDTIFFNQSFYVQIAFFCFGKGQDANFVSPINNTYFIEPAQVAAYIFDSSLIPIPNDSLAKKSSELLSKNRYEEALPIINDLIRRNPFNKELYQLRMLIYKKTNRQELVSEDLRKISDFIPGVSLDELVRK